MKKTKNLVLAFLFAIFAACLLFAFPACKKSEEETSYGFGEEGYYYFDGSDSERYMLSLQGGEYMITVDGETSFSGKYSYEEETGKITFSGDAEFSALMGDSALSLTVEGSGYSFKAYVYFDVTYVDETGKTLATESVLNGQSATGPDIEKDGYWFIGWYEDETHSTEYAFDTSIAGDTVIYGWFVEKIEGATEYEVILDYGDGESETITTRSGAVWSLPKTHAGNTIAGWWVSATNREGELTCKYTAGDALDSDTTLFAVYDGLLTSVTAEGISWDASRAGANVTVTVYGEDGKEILSASVSSSSGLYSSSDFSSLSAGTYTVAVSSGAVSETRVYVVGGLPRVSMSSAKIVSDGEGRVFSFAPVDGAEGYTLTVSNGERTFTEDLGSDTYYDFSDWTMTKEGMTFTVTAYAEGKVSSVSGTYYFRQVLDGITVEISDGEVFWQAVENAEEYKVRVTDVDGNEIDSFVTTDTSFSLKYYGAGTYDIYVKPEASGYWSEEGKYLGYAKDAIAAPQITNVTDYEVTWTPVDGAEYYVVKINGETYEVLTGTTLTFSESGVPDGEGPYEISVMAKAKSGDGNDSPYSDAVTATEGSFVASVTYSRNTVHWTYDVAATCYAVSVNGGETVVEEGNSFKVTLTKSGYNTVAVTAYDKDGGSLGYAEMMIYAYAVTLDPVGAVLMNDAAVNGAIYVAKGDEMNLGTVEKEHADFVGWYTQPDYTEGQSDEYEGKGFPVEDGSTFTGSGSKYLYAYWTYEYVEVTLDAGTIGAFEDGTAGAEVKIKYNSSAYVLPVPVLSSEEYDFTGWYSDDGAMYADGTGSAAGAKYGDVNALHAEYLKTRSYSRTRYDGDVVYSVTATWDAENLTVMTVPAHYTADGAEYDIILSSNAFANATSLEVLNIPDTVRYVALTNDGYRTGTGAFATCAALKEVNVYVTGDGPDSTKEIVYYSADGVLFAKDADTEGAALVYFPFGRETSSYTVPSEVYNENECDAFGAGVVWDVTAISTMVFRDRRITEIIIPSTVTEIGPQAFYGNTYLERAVFEEGGTEPLTIGESAFIYCTSLAEVRLPARFSSLDSGIFYGCTSLMNLYVENGGAYSSDDGVLLDSAGTTLVYVPAGRSGDIDIGALTSATITKIGEGTFASNMRITSVEIPSSVTEIGESAFEGCTALGSVSFGGTATSGDLAIRTRAFYGCVLLTEIRLPVNLTALEYNAFGGCTGITYVYFDARQNTTVSDLDFSEGAFGYTNYIITLEFGANVPEIDFASVFDGGVLRDIVIDENNHNYYVDSQGAVYSGDKTSILYCPRTVSGAFVLDSEVTQIEYYVFEYRVNITSITIGAKVNTIDTDSFFGCTYLEAIYVDSTNPCYGNHVDENGVSDGILYVKDASSDDIVELFYCPLAIKTTDIKVPETVIKTSYGSFVYNSSVTSVEFSATTSFELGEYTFYECTSLTSVVLPDCTTEIPYCAFYDCAKLSSVNIPTSLQTIDDFAFYYCVSLKGDLNDSTNGVKLPEGLVSIGTQAFNMQGSTTVSSTHMKGGSANGAAFAVTIPSTVEYVGDYAFIGCWDNNSDGLSIVFASSDSETEVELVIGDYAFANAEAAKSVAVPARTVSLGVGAFYNLGYYAYSSATDMVSFEEGCRVTEIPESLFHNVIYMSEIEIPASVTLIDSQAFSNCSNLTAVSFAGEGETSSLLEIGSSAFSGTALASVTIPASVTELGTSAFYNISTLKTVTFEEGSALETIGSSSLRGIGISEIVIPASVTSIGYFAFGGDTSLTTVTFATDENGECGIKRLGEGAFNGCSALTGMELPEGFEVTGTGTNGAFTNCTSLETVTIPSTVTTIWYQTFNKCTSLKSVTFSTDDDGKCSLEEIQEKAFTGCTSLVATGDADAGDPCFAFPESTAASIVMGDRIFDGCTSLSRVKLSSSVTDIGNAFAGLTLTNLEVDAGNASYVADENGEPVLYSLDKKSVAYVYNQITSEEIEIPDSIESIGSSAFSGQAGIKKVTIGKDVTSIGSYAFYQCSSLAEVVFADGTAMGNGTIGAYAFAECGSLKTIALPDGLTTIPDGCFQKSDVSNITIPTSVTYVGDYAFQYAGIQSVNLPNVEYVGAMAFGYTGTSVSDFAYDTGLKSATFGNRLATLGDHAFYQSDIESIVFPCLIDEIQSHTFYQCKNLTYVEIPDTVNAIRTYAFYQCTSLKEVVMSSTLTLIYSHAFDGCSALEVCDLPTTFWEMDDYAFNGCTSLKEAVFYGGVDYIGQRCYYGCTSLETVTFGDSVEYICDYAFAGCSKLESVTLGRSLYYLGSYAFQNCTSLVYVYTGAVTSISTYAFNGCTSLETVDFGAGLVSIGSYAFNGCTSLSEVTFGNALTSIGSYAFQNCTSLGTLFLPASVSSVGASAFSGCSFDLYVEETKNFVSSNWTSGWDTGFTGTAYYFTQTEPALNAAGTGYDGNFWHYDGEGNRTVWTLV